MFDYIIVGAGFAGSVIAERISTQQPNKKILIIEQRQHIGGNCYDFKDENGIIIHKYGPHLFHTNNIAVFQYLSKFTEWDIYDHKVLAVIDGKPVTIPFNLNTLKEVFPTTIAQKIENKLLAEYDLNSKIPILELMKSDDADLKFLAKFVYEKIFVNYTAKQWEMKPEDIDSSVTARVPVFIGKDDRYFNDSYQAVPRHGYTKIFEAMLNRPSIKLMLNTNFHEIITINDDNSIEAFGRKFDGKLIFSGKIDDLFGFKYGELTYRSIKLKFETVDKEFYQKATTVNYPNDYDFTRITEFKHIHPSDSKKTTILKEYPLAHKHGENTPYYPFFLEETRKAYNEYAQYAQNFKNIILVGRLAEYKYYDMDDMVERALQVFEQNIKDS